MCFCEQITLNEDFDVSRSWCQCPRGEAVCHHIATVLLYAKENFSKTDAPCSWVRKKIPKEVKTAAKLYPSSKQSVLNREPDNSDRDWFRQALDATDRFSGFAWLLAPEPPVALSFVRNVSDIMLNPEFVTSDNPIAYILEHLAVTPEEIVAIEELTRGQQENPAWGACRKGRITASNFGAVIRNMRSKRRTASKSLLRKLMGEYDLSGMQAIQWGVTHESVAVNTYKQAKDCEVIPSGIWLDSTGCIGGSPDGIVDENCIIEAKCPFSLRETTVTSALERTSFMLKKESSGDIVLNLNSDLGLQYYHQIQGNLYLTNRSWCDLIVWTPLEMVIVYVAKDDSWVGNIELLREFHRETYLPVFVAGGI